MNSNGFTRILEHRFFRRVLQACVAGTMICALGTPAVADEVHRKNRVANKYYEDGDFEKALETYEDALLNAPGEEKLRINKGSALHKLGRLEEAEESYLGAAKTDDPQVKADLWYNLGTTIYKQGEQIMASGGQGAMEKFKAAKDSYIKALDARPGDEDAKWNLQLTQLVLDQLEKQQQEQQKQQNNENEDQNQENDKKQQNSKGDDKKQGDKNQNQDQQNEQKENEKNKDEQGDQSENNKDEQNKDEQQKKDGEDQEKEKREEETKGGEQKKAGDKGEDQSQQSKSAEQMEDEQREKREAARLLEQYSDDHEDLNKPAERIRVLRGKEPEKDW